MMFTELRGFEMICLPSDDGITGECIMAEANAKKAAIEFDPVERGWLKQCIETQRKVLLRSRTKEITGGEIWQLRGREIESLSQLLAKVSA